MRIKVRQALRDAARIERGRCWLFEAFLTDWEADQVRTYAVREGVAVEVAVGEFVRRGIDGLNLREEGNGDDESARPAA